MAPTLQQIDRFIAPGSPLARAGGARTLAKATGGNLAGAAFLALLARKESSFGSTAGRFTNNFWGWGVHLGPSVSTSPTVEEGARKVWQGLSGSLYKGSGLTTPAAIIAKYAPPSENDTRLYQQQVNQWASQVGLSPSSNVFGGPSVPPAGVPAPARPAGRAAAAPAGATSDPARALLAIQAINEIDSGGVQPSTLLSLAEASRAQSEALPRAAGAPKAPRAGKAATNFSGDPLGVKEKVIGTPYAGTHTLGNWESDDAVDLAAPVGTPVYALANGKIGSQFGSLGEGGRFAGLRLHLQTPGNEFYYAHLSRFAPGIKPGATVQRGQLLGYSGEANGVGHLHLGVKKGNPLDILGLR